MFQLIRLGKGHIDADLNRRFRFRFPPVLHNQTDLSGADITDAAPTLPAFSVADQNFLPVLQPQHLGMLCVLSGKHQKIRLKHRGLNKKSDHKFNPHIFSLV